MVDFQDKRIPIFTDVNDVPVAPTADRGGNISHFYDKYNQLVDDLEEHITDVEELAGDGFDQARNADASAYDYYYYNSLPNKNYIIFQNHNTSFNLGNHDLNLGETRIGTIPANGELFRIIAEGEINNYQDILFKVSNVILNVPKFAFYGTGAIWWFYDIAEDYNDPYNGNSIIVTEGEIINVVTSTAETNINFKLEMNVYATLATQQSTPTLEVFEFSQLSTVPQPDNTDVAVIGIIPKTGKLQKIVISKAIENSQIKIPIEVNDDEDSLEEQLKILIEAARIIKAVHWRNLDLKGNVPEQIKSIIKNADKLMSDLDVNGKDTLEDFLNSLQLGFSNKSSKIDSTKPFGRDYNRRPRVKDLD